MLSNVMEKAQSPAADTALPDTPAGPVDVGERGYPDNLDAPLLRISGVCILATVMAILDVTVVSVAQRTFIAEFASTQAVVAWTMTGYTLALATVIPLAGWAADRFGTKRLFMGSLVAFMLGSLLCALASTIVQLIIFRVVQGVGGGMLMPLGFMIMTREAGLGRLGRLMSIMSIPMLLAPIAGPILGGWLIDTSSWKWIFLINLPIGLATIALAAIVFPKDHSAPSETFDVDRRPAALARPGDVPVRGVVHPALRDRRRSPRADTGGNRPGIDRRVRRARVASRRSPTHRSAAVPESGDQLGQCDDADFRRRLFRRRTAIPELLPAGAAPDADAGRSAHDPAGTRGHADHAADRSAGGPTGTGQDRVGRYRV